MKQFNVLEYSWSGEVKPYDVLPRFRNAWNADYNFDAGEVKTKEDLEKWIARVSTYYFWAKCEHEFVMVPWPYNNDPEKFKKSMYKIDVHEQIKMNRSLIADILWEEFGLGGRDEK